MKPSEPGNENQLRPRRILILTADAGFGHRSAANAVAVALQEKYPGRCEVNIVNPLEHKSVPFFVRDSQSDYDTIVRKAPELYQLGYDASDAPLPSTIVESALTVFLYEAMRDTIKKYQPEVILTTYPLYQMPLEAVYTIHNNHIPLLTVITDLSTVHRLWFSNKVDYCLVPNEIVKNKAVVHGIPPENIQITGIPVNPAFLRNEKSRKEFRLELGWKTELPTYLAVASTRVENVEKLLDVINHFGLQIQLIIVTGNDRKLFANLHRLDWHIPVKIYGFVENIPDMMKASDVLISKAGGLIVTEGLACGLPMILIDIIPGQETGNAQFVVENGAGCIAETEMEMLQALAHLNAINQKMLKQRGEKARKLGKPEAAWKVADLVWQAMIQKTDRLENQTFTRSKLIALLTKNKIHWEDNPFKWIKNL